MPGNEFQEKEPILIPSWDDYIKERYEAESLRLGYEIDEVFKQFRIDEEGDGYTHTRFKGIRITNPQAYREVKDTEINPFTLHTVTGRLVPLPPKHRSQSRPRFLSIEPSIVKGVLGLPDYIDPKDAIDIAFPVWTLNAWALNQEQFKRKYLGKFGDEAYEEEWYDARRPVRVFREVIRLPKNCRPIQILLLVSTPKDQGFTEPDQGLQQHYASALNYDEQANTITLAIQKPLIGFRYAVRWVLPPKLKRSIDVRFVGECETLVSRLRVQGHEVVAILRAAAELIREEIPCRSEDFIDVSVGIPIEDAQSLPVLRAVADNLSGIESENCELVIGDGIPGRAYNLNQALVHVEHSGRKHPKSNYVPFGRIHSHKVLYAIPMRHPLEQEAVLGVLTVGSQMSYSSLIPTRGQPAKLIIKKLIDIVEDFVVLRLSDICGGILSAVKPQKSERLRHY